MDRKDFRPNDSGSTSGKYSNPTIPKRKVVDNFLKGQGGKTGNKSLSTDGKQLKSYDTVIAIRQANGTILVNNTKYSSTTSAQQNILMQKLKADNHKYEVTGGKARGYEGEDLSEKSIPKAKEMYSEEARNVNKRDL